MNILRAADIHARLSSSWPAVLEHLGIEASYLRRRHGRCPICCAGKDRFRFDNRRGRGDYICGQCGAGDGFTLLQRVHGWSFAEARKRVIEAAGLSEYPTAALTAPTSRVAPAAAIATPTERVLRLRRGRCRIEDCAEVVDYLASRGLWPLPEGCALWAHASAEYWDGPQRIGRYPAIVADVVDLTGELVTVHVTYLSGGRKLADHEPRKLLSPLTGRAGCAVRLMPATDVLGIAEGIETALSAAALDGIPVWAALNASLLGRFEPPLGVARLRIYADRDEAGLSAAAQLMQRLQGRVRFELRVPSPPAKDFNDVLLRTNHV